MFIIEWRNCPTNHNPTQYIKCSTLEEAAEHMALDRPNHVAFNITSRMRLPIGANGCAIRQVYETDGVSKKLHYDFVNYAGDNHISGALHELVAIAKKPELVA